MALSCAPLGARGAAAFSSTTGCSTSCSTSTSRGVSRAGVRLPVRPRADRARTHASASPEPATVSSIMTPGEKIIVCQLQEDCTSALQKLVSNSVNGLPVLSPEGVVVGVVSDFDLLALDLKRNAIFPPTDETWQAFKAVQQALAKSNGKCVQDVMTPNPITVRPDTNLDDATSVLLAKRIRRLPVVDGNGKLLGLLSRSNIVKHALQSRQSS